jgi:hypothetical protein
VVAGLGIWFARRKRADLAALAAVALLASFAGAYSAVKLPVGAAIQASNLRWMWTVSAFTWVAMFWLIWEALRSADRKFLTAPILALSGLAMLLTASGVVSTMDLSTDRDGRVMADIDSLVARVKANLPKGTYRFQYRGGSAIVSIGPALIHALDHSGYGLRADLGPISRAYADHREWRKGDDVDGTLTISSEASTSYAEGVKLIARQRFDVNRKDASVNTVRIYLEEGSA